MVDPGATRGLRVHVVGAGPAGLAAARTLIDHGLAPTVIDEAPRPGGQAYRTARAGLDMDLQRLYGKELPKYKRIHAMAATVRERADYRPQHLAWACHDGVLHVAGPDGADALAWDALVIASGATDRILPVTGWTRPGVFTLGAAQVLLKDQGCFIGRNIVFCGSSPLLYLAASQYHALGAKIVAVLDTTPFGEKLRAAPRLLADVRTFGRGLATMARLRAAGVRIEHGVRLMDFAGDASGVTSITVRARAGLTLSLQCDAVACGFGLRPETQLAELAGCAFAFDPVFRQWLPRTDRDGRAGDGVYLAGDGQTIGGADAAEASGELAALAALDDLGVTVSAARQRNLRTQVARMRYFQTGLARAFAWPHALAGDIADDVPVCRCENVTAGTLRETLALEHGPREINRLKALTRCGMGRCQGRVCERAAAEVAASALGAPIEAIGKLRVQAPVKPLPVWVADPPGAA